MQTWIIYGILASFSWGIYIILSKLASQKGLNSYLIGAGMGFGVFLFLFLFYLFKRPTFNNNWAGLGLAVLSGILWAVGMIAVIIAIANKAPVSRLAPLYNTNILIVVLIGILFLKETHSISETIRIIIGALLVIAGSILVSI